MKFTRDAIIDFKAKRRAYLTWRKKLNRLKIKEAFFPNSQIPVQEIFPGRNIEYCQIHAYRGICVGDYHLGIKYTDETGTYYMFLAANTFWAAPQDVAVGKAVDGQIYLLREFFYPYSYELMLRRVPEEYVNKDVRGFVPRGYEKNIFMVQSRTSREELRAQISDEDIKCLKIAYEGVRAFSKLIEEWEQRQDKE